MRLNYQQMLICCVLAILAIVLAILAIVCGVRDQELGPLPQTEQPAVEARGPDGFRQVQHLDIQEKVTAADASTNQNFGYSVAMSQDVVVIGDINDDEAGTDAGGACVLMRNQGGADAWGQIVKLGASDAAPLDHFGGTVAIDGDIIVVGAYGAAAAGNSSGAAYVFYRNKGGPDNWGQQKKLVADDAAELDCFGRSVSIDGDLIAVGANLDDTDVSNAGSVYLFKRNQGGEDVWGQIARLNAEDQSTDSDFGSSVKIADDMIIVGASRSDDVHGEAGAAYILARNLQGADVWGQLLKITAPVPTQDARFGSSVDLNKDIAVIGASSSVGEARGAVHIFYQDRGGGDAWGHVDTIEGNSATSNLGNSVSIQDGLLAAGAIGEDNGQVHVFERNKGGADQWEEVATFAASDASAGHRLGSAVAISGHTVIAGAPMHRSGNNYIGAAYVFEVLADNDWVEQTQASAEGLSNGEVLTGLSALDGDTFAIRTFNNGTQIGSVCVFERNENGADMWGQVAKTTVTDGSIADNYPGMVALDNDHMVIGSRHNSSNRGVVYVASRNHGGDDNWGIVATLLATDGSSGHYLGHGVSIDGDTILTGAHGWGDWRGSAYIFQRNEGGADKWGQTQILLAEDGNSIDCFGCAVDLQGDIAVVGSPRDAIGAGDTGSAYVFYRHQGGADKWGQIKKLSAHDASGGDCFGTSVYVDGDLIMVTAMHDAAAGPEVGTTYLFQRNNGGPDNWGFLRKLSAADGPGNDYTTLASSLSQGTIALGAYKEDTNGSDSGALYLFERNLTGVDAWDPLTKLTSSSPVASGRFGVGIAISGSVMVAVAPGEVSSDGVPGVFHFYYPSELANHASQME